MHPLQKRFHDFIKQKHLISFEDKVLLAVSGGLDSMVLATLFLNEKFDFSIAHCNFGLRGEESNGDQDLVSKWAKENEIEFFNKQINLDGGSIQLAARNARYRWFDELIEKHHFHKLVTGHHLNDSLETTLINLTRGTGIKGISGIQPINGIKVRPLLFATKEELKNFALETGVAWREDSSNAKNDYDRNIIRNVVVPNLEELNPSLSNTFRNTSERLQLANLLLKEKIKEVKQTFLNKNNGLFELNIDWIKSDSDKLIFSEIVSEFGFNYITSKEIHSVFGKSGRFFLSDKHRLTIDRKSIFIEEINNIDNEEFLILEEGEHTINGNRLIVSITEGAKMKLAFDKNIACLDASKIQFPLLLRKWKHGDRFKPFGMSGTKKVSDFLIDRKVPLALKEKVSVLTSKDQILWILGHQISEDYKVDEETKKILRVEFK